MVQSGPEVEDVAVEGAIALEALGDVFAEVDRKGFVATIIADTGG